ncbi:MAG: hypothetical protein AABW48_04225, partial [Nanoarchaeota archaeon]
MKEKTLPETNEKSVKPLEEIIDNKRPFSCLSLRDSPLFQRIVQEDLEKMKSKIALDLHDPVWNILLVQSIQGHAQNGHGLFNTYNCKYPQATIPDVIAAAGMDINTIKAARQELIDEVYAWVNLALDNHHTHNNKENNNAPLTQDRLQLNHKPLLRIKFIEEYLVDPVFILKGIVLAGHMDNYQSRMETINHYKTTIKGNPLEIGGGETYLVDLEMLAKAGLDQVSLANIEHDDQKIDYLRRLGVIVDGTCSSNSNIES